MENPIKMDDLGDPYFWKHPYRGLPWLDQFHPWKQKNDSILFNRKYIDSFMVDFPTSHVSVWVVLVV